jgi:carboxyl-terminal processing protease
MNPRLAGNLALVAVMTALLLSFKTSWASSATPLEQVGLIVDLRHELVDEYVETPDQQKLLEGAVRGMIDSLNDPYTVYMSPEEFGEFNKAVSGSFSGIGAEVRINEAEERLEIVTPLEDSPAWNAGVMAGDIVLEINGEDTKGLSVATCVSKLTGEAGTDVTITVRHPTGEEATITITRAQIQVDTVRGFMRDADQHYIYWLDESKKIAYVRLSQFSEKSVEELVEVLTRLKSEGMEGLIFDLRFNPGGLLEAAEAISDMFLPEGKTIVSVKGRSVPERVFKSTGNTLIGEDIEVVVIANEASASASEIVTGALSENDRALFVGTRTFGKGSVQQLKLLDGAMGALKMTNAYYYLPSGRNIHRRPINGDHGMVKVEETVTNDNGTTETKTIEKEKPWGVDPSEGSYVLMSPEQYREMLDARRNRDIVRQGNGQITAGPITPQWLRDELKDPQLAAAYEAMLGKFDTGNWPAVGQSNAEAIARQTERESLERLKSELEKRIAEIDDQLATTQPPTAGTTDVLPAEVKPNSMPSPQSSEQPAPAASE